MFSLLSLIDWYRYILIFFGHRLAFRERKLTSKFDRDPSELTSRVSSVSMGEKRRRNYCSGFFRSKRFQKKLHDHFGSFRSALAIESIWAYIESYIEYMIRFIRFTDMHVYVLLGIREIFWVALSFSALLWRNIAFISDRRRAVICYRPSGCISGWLKGWLNVNGTAVSRQLIRKFSKCDLRNYAMPCTRKKQNISIKLRMSH